jgi:penicillin-binding protein-related factor A (putative recombinase)|tara:strand:- start:2429 stop:2824 length:396 start_codon:yes stop_codon:yes gene_type:complete
MARERDLWLLLKNNLTDIHFQRIETGLTGSGVPDVNGCAKGKEFWIELKEIHRGKSLTLRPMQVAWMAKRSAVGGQVFVLARKQNVIKLYHVDGLSGAKELQENPKGFYQKSLVTLIKPYEWGNLYSALLS